MDQLLCLLTAKNFFENMEGKMIVKSIEVGPIGTNCYFVINEKNNQGVVVDPGGSSERIVTLLKELNLDVKAIFITHGHMDHIGALKDIKEFTKASIYVSKLDAPMLINPQSNLSAFMGAEISCPPADKNYGDGDEIEVGGLKFKILATPGHTPGGVCICIDNIVFCGDTIFCESVGRTDFPGGSYEQILKSIKTKILILSPETILYPGHGPATSVDWEKRRNPFLQ